MKLIPGKKAIIAIIIVAALIGVYFVSTSAVDWDEGAPEATINCEIRAVGSSASIGGNVDIDSNTNLGATQSFTTFTSTIPTLDANTQYSISFSASMTTKTAKFGESLTNAITVSGTTGGSAPGKNYLATGDIASSSASVAGTAGASSTLAIPGFVKRSTASTPVVIMGDVIDGSVFTFTITSTATDGRASSTTATLGITITSGGTIYLTIDNITTTLAAALYPSGWNVPGNVNYIVVSAVTGGPYKVLFYTSGGTGEGYGTLAVLRTYLSTTGSGGARGLITQTQYDCGIAQITALGG
jgi:hypothetical protein